MNGLLDSGYSDDFLKAIGIDKAKMQEQQRSQGLLNVGLALLAGSGPSTTPTSLGQLVAQAGSAGIQAMRGAGEDQISNAIRSLQVKDMMAKREQQQKLQSLIPQVFKQRMGQVPTTIPTETGEDYKTTVPGAVGYEIDPNKIQALMAIPGGMEYVKGIAETNKLLRQSGLGSGGGQMISPFSMYLTSQNPQVRQLAQTYEQGFQSGRIDEDTADKRALDLARMEESFQSRTEAAKDRAAMAAEGRAERSAAREEKKLEGTESQKAAAGFAERMVNSEGILSQLPQQALPTTGTSIAASVPFVGGYLERQVMSGEQQKFKQAASDWIRAKLRKESGAAIGEQEMEQEYETYFPMPGDGPEVIAQKAEARKIATQAMIKNAGPVYTPQTIAPNPKGIKKKFNLE